MCRIGKRCSRLPLSNPGISKIEGFWMVYCVFRYFAVVHQIWFACVMSWGGGGGGIKVNQFRLNIRRKKVVGEE